MLGQKIGTGEDQDFESRWATRLSTYVFQNEINGILKNNHTQGEKYFVLFH